MNSSDIRKFRSEIREYKKELKEQGKKFNYDDKVARDIFKKYHPCYFYAINSVNDENVPKYVQLQCQQFLDEFERQDEEDSKFVLDMKDIIKVTNVLKNINFASGMRMGTPVLYGLAQFQWFFIINTLCWKHKSDLEKRRYEKSVLLIGRKSGKSFLVGLIFILLLLLEPTYSEFYSVAPDRELSSIVKKEAEQLISVSEGITRWFKINNKEIVCKANKSKFVPLALSNNRMDGRKANVFVADEVGALPTRYPIDAMQSSQMSMKNRLGILISTAYNTEINPMTEEIEYCSKVLDGTIDDETCFSLLYMPDDRNDWMSDKALRQANPLAIEIEENFEYLVRQRKKALEIEGALTNFKTKHLNIFVNGNVGEVYIDLEDFQKCKLDKEFDWDGRGVYVGLDLSQTTDNTCASMVAYDWETNIIYIKAMAFIPENAMEKKSKLERVDYALMEKQGFCISCGENVIDYSVVEGYIMTLEEKYGVHILGVGYDRYNCISTANKLINNNINAIEVKQHSSVLHPATKFLKERVLSDLVRYEPNRLLELSIANSRESLDTNLNGYVNKKKSNGKIDMVVATINALALLVDEISDDIETSITII